MRNISAFVISMLGMLPTLISNVELTPNQITIFSNELPYGK
jgi:hypothetical protein